SIVPSVGASGAISGVMGAYVLLYPRNRVRVLFGYWWIFHVPAFLFLGIWFLTQFVNGLMALNVATAQAEGVAFWAHIGGFVAGLVVGLFLGAVRPERERVRPLVSTSRDKEGWLWLGGSGARRLYSPSVLRYKHPFEPEWCLWTWRLCFIMSKKV